jgi:thioredoxin reductase (NADPH)
VSETLTQRPDTIGIDENEPIFDINIIGAGPTGLFAAFYAGLRGMSVQIIDSLEEVGGQCAAMYPEKYIYDVIGYPKVLAKDFVAACLEQAMRSDPVIQLREQVQDLVQLPDGTFAMQTSKGVRRSVRADTAWGTGCRRSRRQGRALLRQACRGLPRQEGCHRWWW